MRIGPLWSCALALIIAAVAPAGAGAATINVNTTTDTFADDGLCSVREAVTTANTNQFVNGIDAGSADCTVGSQHPTADTIQLAAATYTLALAGASNDNNQTGDLDVRVDSGGTAGGPVTIAGQGSGQTEIDAADLDRVLHVTIGPGTLTLQGLRLDNGTAPAGEQGGALYNNQANATSVQASDVRISNSFSPAAGGGVFWSSNGTLALSNGSQVDGNAVTVAAIGNLGGGVAFANGTLNINDSAVSGNTATDTSAGIGAGVTGGGISASNATLNVTRSTISSNTLAVPTNAIDFPEGGGIFLQNTSATILDSTISGNSVTGGNIRGGGGLYHLDTTNTVDKLLTIQNSTFSGNSVTAGANSLGGAIRINGGNTTVTASTVSGNTAATGGADALYAVGGGQANASLQLRSSIFNEGTNGCAYPNPAGFGVSTGYNIDAGATCWAVNAAGDQQNTPVSLGALALNGGSTQTHELQSGSNGIDDVPNADCDEADGDPLAADQRGVPRPQGAACDVGAYERGGTCLGQAATVVGTSSGDTINGTSAADVIVALGGADTVNAGDGADRVCGGDGNDTIRGGDGNDSDQLDGEGDTDTLSFSDLSAGVTAASLGAGTTSGTQVGTDTVSNFENMVGSDFNDGTSSPLNGSLGPNTIDGGAGTDTIQGIGGDDTLVGGANPAVSLPGSPGDTASYLNSGLFNPINASLLTGTATGEGTDTLSGFESLTGGSAGDSLTGDSGINNINGFSGDDTLEGREGNDFFTGGPDEAGGDTVSFSTVAGPVNASLGPVFGTLSASGQGTDGGNGIENLTGTGNDDILTGDDGPNVLTGGNGSDTLRDGSSVNTPANADTFNGGPLSDTVSYEAKGAAEPVIVNLLNTAGQGEAGESDSITADIESVTGGSGGDTITGDEGSNLLTGGPGSGSDTILAGGGADTLEGGGGNDTLDGEAQSDTVSYSYAALGAEIDLGADSVFAGPGDTDSVPNVENATGSAGSDIFFDGPVEDNVYDGAGDADFVNYQSATAAMTVDLATGTATGAGSDQLAAIENVEGGPQGDTITGDAGANNLRGFGGGDTISGGLGADDVFGGDGPDQLLVRDGIADDADCGPADAVTDTVQADLQGTDVLANCETDTVDFGVPVTPPVTPPANPPATSPKKKCKKGFKLKKVKTKSGKVKKKCVRKKRKRK